MSVLSEKPDSEFFRSIPDFDNAVSSFTEKNVPSILSTFGETFANHGVSNEFGLAMVHRHFDITENEILVETFNDEKSLSVSTPWIIEGNALVAPSGDNVWKELKTKIKEYVVPQTWSFDVNGDLKAFEYLTSDEPLRNPPQAFVAEFYAKLQEMELEKYLGIRRIDNVLGQSGWESTPLGSRSNVVVFGTKPDSNNEEKFVTVLWYFDKDGNLWKGLNCYKHCYHCYYHEDAQNLKI